MERLLDKGWRVTVVDNFDPFYDEKLKRANVKPVATREGYRLIEADIRDLTVLRAAIPERPDVIVHLAARAGVRPSIEDPVGYQETNVRGTQNVLEVARSHGTKQFVFASSSSVYGVNPNVPWKESDHVLAPISPYASTKVSGEMLGHVYSHLYGMRFVALRFFTAYGPRQRPDLAIHKFARRILRSEPITLYGDGSTRRDYTYVGDIVSGIVGAISYDRTSFEVFNLGNSVTVSLDELVLALEETLGVRAVRQILAEQPGDVPQTWADISKAKVELGYVPRTTLTEGLGEFAKWLRQVG